MANGISKNPLTDIGKVYLTQIAEGRLKSLEKASVLAMSAVSYTHLTLPTKA